MKEHELNYSGPAKILSFCFSDFSMERLLLSIYFCFISDYGWLISINPINMNTKSPKSPPKTAFAIFVSMCREEHSVMFPKELLGKYLF